MEGCGKGTEHQTGRPIFWSAAKADDERIAIISMVFIVSPRRLIQRPRFPVLLHTTGYARFVALNEDG